MTDIKPMLLTEIEFTADVFDKYKNWIFQEKQNGIRAIGHYKKGIISSMRNRNNIPVLSLFPELIQEHLKEECDAILDGEVVVNDANGRSMFYGGINQRSKKLYGADHLKKFPITFVVFDVLYLNGQVVADKPYSERYAMLQSLLSDTATLKLAKNIDNPKEHWEQVITKENREGFVIKNPAGKYEVDTRSKNFIKMKHYKFVDVLVERTELNNKGTKIFGKAIINGQDIVVEAQIQDKKEGLNSISVGDVRKIRYLDVVGNKLVQPSNGEK